MATAATTPQQRFASETEIAATYGISVKTLRKWRFFGHGPTFYKLGRAVRYDVAEVERFVRATARKPAAEGRTA